MPRALNVLAAIALVASPAYAQVQIPPESPSQATSDISFEVVSVKVDPARSRSEAGPPTLVMHPSGRFTAMNVTVTQLILNAYGLRASQIAGGPDWMSGQYFDILAQAPVNFEMGQTRQMMRRLLEQRFGLVIQRATKVGTVYALEWINNSRTPGRWLRRSSTCDRPPADPPEDMVGPVGSRRTPTTRGQREASEPECPGFFGSGSTAREQLGLKFEPTTSNVEMLVIERLERPSEN